MKLPALLVALTAALVGAPSQGIVLEIQWDRGDLPDAYSEQLALTLVDGGAPANNVRVFGIPGCSSGHWSGSFSDPCMPGGSIMSDATAAITQFIGAWAPLQPATLRLEFTSNGPDTESFPDQFSIALLPHTTNDPLGAHALFVFDFDGSPHGGSWQVFDVLGTTAGLTVSLVPEPPGALLWTVGLAWLLRRRPQRWLATLGAVAGTAASWAAPSGFTDYMGNFVWVRGVPTPPLVWARANHIPSEANMSWDLYAGIADLWRTVDNYGNGNPSPNLSFGGALLPYEYGCYTLLDPVSCVIGGRHTFPTAGTRVFRVRTQQRATLLNWPAVAEDGNRFLYVQQDNSKLDVLSLGDSVASGEGAPTWRTGVADRTFWETRFTTMANLRNKPGATPDERYGREAHRSYWAGPSLAAMQTQTDLLNELVLGWIASIPAVDFWHLAWTGMKVNEVRTRQLELVGTDSGIDPYFFVPTHLRSGEPINYRAGALVSPAPDLGGLPYKPYDVVTISAGLNDVNVSTRIRYCHRVLEAACMAMASNSITVHKSDGANEDDTVLPPLYDQLAELPARFAALAHALRMNPYTRSAKVVITGYADFRGAEFEDDSGIAFDCDGGPAGFNRVEANFIIRFLYRFVNDWIQNAANVHGWTYVRPNFRGHGMCEGDGQRWILTFADSLAIQADPNGFYHPNWDGHAAYAAGIKDTILPLGRDRARKCALSTPGQLGSLTLSMSGLRPLPGQSSAWGASDLAGNPTQGGHPFLVQAATLRNLSQGASVPGPLILKMKDLNPRYLSTNADGWCNDGPYVTLLEANQSLAPGQTLSKTLEFTRGVTATATDTVRYKPTLLR